MFTLIILLIVTHSSQILILKWFIFEKNKQELVTWKIIYFDTNDKY